MQSEVAVARRQGGRKKRRRREKAAAAEAAAKARGEAIGSFVGGLFGGGKDADVKKIIDPTRCRRFRCRACSAAEPRRCPDAVPASAPIVGMVVAIGRLCWSRRHRLPSGGLSILFHWLRRSRSSLDGAPFRPRRSCAPISTAAGFALGDPAHIRIFKREQRLELWLQRADGRYALFRDYDICKFSGELGPKLREGDRQSPEGFYRVGQRSSIRTRAIT